MSSCWVDLLPELLPLVRAHAQQLDMRTRMRLRLVCRAWLAADPETYFRVTSTHGEHEDKELTFRIDDDALWATEIRYLSGNHYMNYGGHTTSLAVLFHWLCLGPASFSVRGGTWNQLRDTVYAIPFVYTQFRKRRCLDSQVWSPRNYGEAFAIWSTWNKENEYWECPPGRVLILDHEAVACVTFELYAR